MTSFTSTIIEQNHIANNDQISRMDNGTPVGTHKEFYTLSDHSTAVLNVMHDFKSLGPTGFKIPVGATVDVEQINNKQVIQSWVMKEHISNTRK
jgi:hypothetical protein